MCLQPAWLHLWPWGRQWDFAQGREGRAGLRAACWAGLFLPFNLLWDPRELEKPEPKGWFWLALGMSKKKRILASFQALSPTKPPQGRGWCGCKLDSPVSPHLYPIQFIGWWTQKRPWAPTPSPWSPGDSSILARGLPTCWGRNPGAFRGLCKLWFAAWQKHAARFSVTPSQKHTCRHPFHYAAPSKAQTYLMSRSVQRDIAHVSCTDAFWEI